MFVTLTMNPAIDLTFSVVAFSPNEVNRATSVRKDPAGKGINVARALALNGFAASAVFPGDDANGRWLEATLDREGVHAFRLPRDSEIRTNVVVTDQSGNTTTLNDHGPVVTSGDALELRALVLSALESRPAWLVLAGGLPPGIDETFYADVARDARREGVRVAVDSSGGALAAVAHAGVAHVMKPNHRELEELAGRPLPLIGDVVDFAQSVLAHDDAAILTSLGKHGAILVTHSDVQWGAHPPVTVSNSVGAGDASLAGYLAADVDCRRRDIGGHEANTARLSTAVAWGSAKAQLSGTTMPGPDNISVSRVLCSGDLNRDIRIEDL